MNEILIREALVFGGAVVGVAWGYYFGKIIERRRFAAEVRAKLEAIERWTIDVCRDLDDLERTLARMGHLSVSEVPADVLAETRALHDTRPVPPLGLADEAALTRFVSRVTNRA